MEATRTAPVGEPPGELQDLVRIRDLVYAYPGGVLALGGVTFNVERGEIVAVVGPSGSGKSTLLRQIAGFLAPDGGSIEVADLGDGRHRCSMLFQEETLLPWMRVRGNAELFERLHRGRRRSSAPAHETVEQLLDMVDLRSVTHLYPYQLSGGMKRRLAVVTAVAALPQLLLLDEPFSALDEPTRISLHGQVHSVLRHFDITSVLVTHDLAEAICLSDRIIVLSARPATVVREYVVPFGEERDMMALRSSSEFLRLYGEVWDTLRAQMPAPEPSGPSGPVQP